MKGSIAKAVGAIDIGVIALLKGHTPKKRGCGGKIGECIIGRCQGSTTMACYSNPFPFRYRGGNGFIRLESMSKSLPPPTSTKSRTASRFPFAEARCNGVLASYHDHGNETQ